MDSSHKETGGGSVGAACMAARAALPRRMHPVAAACGHRPLRGKPSNPGVNRDPVPGGHKARPYGETGGGSVGADFISARAHRRVGCTLADRTQKSLPLVTKGRWHAKRDGEVCRPKGGGASAPSAQAETLREAFGAETPLRRYAPAPLKGSLPSQATHPKASP